MAWEFRIVRTSSRKEVNSHWKGRRSRTGQAGRRSLHLSPAHRSHWFPPLQLLVISSSDTGAHVCPGSYAMPSYGGTWRHYPFVPPIFKLENFVPSCWGRPAFSLEGKVFGGDVCARLSCLLAEEPGDNEDYLTETNTDKWSTFLNSFQSTNFYFLSFSGALRNL